MSSRDALYRAYAEHPSHAEAGRVAELAPVYRSHLRGWLPADPSQPVLDLGCGDGSLLACLADLGHTRLVGVDHAEVQASRARAAVPGAEIVQGDSKEFLRGRSGAFAAIFCVDVLEHLSRDELFETVALMLAALRPGGALVARIPNADSPFHDAIRYGDLTHEIGFAPGALVHLFHATGFTDVSFREAPPVAKGVKSAVRWLLWQLLRQLVRGWNLVETGSGGAGVYTRVAYVRAVRPASDQAASSG